MNAVVGIDHQQIIARRHVHGRIPGSRQASVRLMYPPQRKVGPIVVEDPAGCVRAAVINRDDLEIPKRLLGNRIQATA